MKVPQDQVHQKVKVVGAGLVGAVQALLLARSGFSVTVVEKRNLLSASTIGEESDGRTVALSHRSWQLLSSAGLWPDIDHCPIQTVHVTQQGKFGSVKLHARKFNVEALGYVVSTARFELFLHDQLRHEPGITVLESASVVSLDKSDADAGCLACLTVEQAGELTTLVADLVIAADGTHSGIRSMLGIDVEERDYQQCAMLANVSTTEPHRRIAFERFTGEGPLALLPLNVGNGNRKNSTYSMIFTAPYESMESLRAISDENFLHMLQQKFGGKLGRFEKIGKRFVTPLKLNVSKKQVDGRFVLIGNAARTLHPVAGQGMNLALRDVFELVSQLSLTNEVESALEEFVSRRQRDQKQVTMQTDVLARAFSVKPRVLRAPMALLSSSSFLLLDFIDPVKKTFGLMNMGHHMPLPGSQRDRPAS